MNVQFSKYHGTGNDFILIDGRNFAPSLFKSAIIRKLCHRYFGIGADGLIILLQGNGVDFKMKYFNADGKEGSMCGNGGRCITAFANRLGIIKETAQFESIVGIHEATILPDAAIRIRLNDVSGVRTLKDGYLLDTGSPHFVIFVENPDEIPVSTLGRKIRNEERFKPGGVNVNFVKLVPGTDKIRVRTYERGVENETLSCGTGVTASAISSYIHKKSDILSYHVMTPGGELHVSFKPGPGFHFSEIYLTGPVAHVFDGEINLTRLK